VDRVLCSRLQFCIKIAVGEIPIGSLAPGIQIKLHGLEQIMRSFLETLKRPDGLIEFIDNIAGGNIRLALNLVRQFFGSGHVDTQKIVKKYDESGTYYVPLHEFLRAVIYGDAVYYEPQRSYIANVFDVAHPDPKEYFLVCILIGFLQEEGARASQRGFVEIRRVYERLQSIGFTIGEIDLAIVRSIKKNLIETGGRRIPDIEEPIPEVLRTSSVGVYHVRRMVRLFTYVDAMIVDTPILDERIRSQITDVHTLQERLERARIFKEYLDQQWRSFGYNGPEFEWTSVSHDLHVDIDSIKEKQAAFAWNDWGSGEDAG
jgi:hypothetical protein